MKQVELWKGSEYKKFNVVGSEETTGTLLAKGFMSYGDTAMHLIVIECSSEELQRLKYDHEGQEVKIVFNILEEVKPSQTELNI